MTDIRENLLARIRAERERQLELPGSEWDERNSPNDWVALIAHYVGDEVRRNGQTPNREAFEDALVKAAAVILAALEHTDAMTQKKQLR